MKGRRVIIAQLCLAALAGYLTAISKLSLLAKVGICYALTIYALVLLMMLRGISVQQKFAGHESESNEEAPPCQH